MTPELTERETILFLAAIGGNSYPEEVGLNRVSVNKDALHGALETNLESHRAIYEQAMEGYKRAAVAWLEQRLDDLRDGKTSTLYFREPMPEDHSDDYERTLQMIEWSIDTEVELSAEEFSRFVLDDWGWKKQWSTVAETYLAQ